VERTIFSVSRRSVSAEISSCAWDWPEVVDEKFWGAEGSATHVKYLRS